jgi:hypothetical protein
MDEFRLICFVKLTHCVRGIDRGYCDQVRGTVTDSPSSGRQGMTTLRLESRTPADHITGKLVDDDDEHQRNHMWDGEAIRKLEHARKSLSFRNEWR